MLTHDKRRIHKLKPVFKIKSLYNEKRLPQVPESFCKKCLRNVSLAVSPDYIFFVIGNRNRRRIPRVWKLVVIASRRKNIGKTTLYNSNYITGRHFEHFLVVSPQYGPPGIPYQRRGGGAAAKLLPRLHSFRLKEIKSILAKTN